MSGKAGILIVGAGIGSLTLARELRCLGLRSKVVEAGKERWPLGLGINMQASASIAFVSHRLGLEMALAGTALEMVEAVYHNRFSQDI